VTAPGANGYGDDALGFGAFPGQFGMAVFSKYPIRTDKIRTFQKFLWKDMPVALLPDDSATPAPKDWYSPAELAIFPLSSKSHWDIPIRIGKETVLTSHPTPPVFDGAEDRNGKRNFDEIRRFADYISGGSRASYVYDDDGKEGGVKHGELFVIAGDQNSDPVDGDSIDGSAQLLLEHALVNTGNTPSSPGGPQQASLQGQQNASPERQPGVRHRRLRRQPALQLGQSQGRLRAAAEEHAHPGLRGLLAAEHGSALQPSRRAVPVPELRPQARLGRRLGRRRR
jgi:3-phytase